ncbi:uncharacterized protein [Physeter macrocephalus]|uniref:Uncharacterized protein isoform X1 n=1 Tax=Physeter macrocephalus TaxID=9755 RepID=A0A455BIQ1_PHYMC|nr:uncharacterized protein LOC114486582 isoform X1 [Physeter catodon]|eukprot:XP_028347773.1 uncharacterized protein LOC114486582 isoform X2 [Physeter catodon]
MCFSLNPPRLRLLRTWHYQQVKMILRDSQVRDWPLPAHCGAQDWQCCLRDMSHVLLKATKYSKHRWNCTFNFVTSKKKNWYQVVIRKWHDLQEKKNFPECFYIKLEDQRDHKRYLPTLLSPDGKRQEIQLKRRGSDSKLLTSVQHICPLLWNGKKSPCVPLCTVILNARKQDPSILEKSGKCSIEAAEEGSYGGLKEETLPGKQEQQGERATVLSQPCGLGHVL